MIFRVTPKTGPTFDLTPDKLYEQLMMAVVDKKKDEQLKGGESVIEVLGQWLTGTGYIIKYELTSSLWIAFKLGCYYARFLDKNNVQIVQDSDQQINKDIK